MAAVGSGRTAACECKWISGQAGAKDVRALEDKARAAGLMEAPHSSLYFYSRNGFTREAEKALLEANGRAFSEKSLLEWVKAVAG